MIPAWLARWLVKNTCHYADQQRGRKMIVRRGDKLKKEDTGILRKEEPSGVTIKWLFHRELGDERYRHTFAVRELECAADRMVRKHNHEHVEAYYVVSGRMLVETDGVEKAEIGPGDLVVHYSWQKHSIKPIGGEPIKIIVCNECLGTGDNCSEAAWIGLHHIEPKKSC